MAQIEEVHTTFCGNKNLSTKAFDFVPNRYSPLVSSPLLRFIFSFKLSFQISNINTGLHPH